MLFIENVLNCDLSGITTQIASTAELKGLADQE